MSVGMDRPIAKSKWRSRPVLIGAAAAGVLVLGGLAFLVDAQADQPEHGTAGVHGLADLDCDGARDALPDDDGAGDRDLARDRPTVAGPKELLRANVVQRMAPLTTGEAATVQGVEGLRGRPAVAKAERSVPEAEAHQRSPRMLFDQGILRPGQRRSSDQARSRPLLWVRGCSSSFFRWSRIPWKNA